jgi:hypothetical protein
VPAFPLSVHNNSSDSILHVSASDTAVRYNRLFHGLPPLLTILLLTKFSKCKLIVILPFSSITKLSIRPLSCIATHAQVHILTYLRMGGFQTTQHHRCHHHALVWKKVEPCSILEVFSIRDSGASYPALRIVLCE